MLRISSLGRGTNPPEISGVFDINRDTKWVQVRQFSPEHRPRRSSARQTISPRLCPTAKRWPCHARVRIFGHNGATDSAPTKHCPCYAQHTSQRDFPFGLLLRATDTSLYTQRHLLRNPLPRRSNTTATLNHRPSRQLSFGSVSTD